VAHRVKLIVGILLAAAGLSSQTVSQPAFDAAVVRPVHDDTQTWAIRQVTATRYRSLSNVMQLVTWAWQMKNYQILGAPAWTSEERFEIQATPGHSSTTDEQRLMLQELLMERFGLKVHTERREMAVYVLVTGKDGPKLGTPKENTDPGHRGINIESGVLIARSGTMDDFVGVLTTNLDRPVLNQTNLNGKYDFTLTWDQLPANGAQWSPIGPALFTPIRELGLRLDSAKAPVETLVIDAVERPTEP
jgi:uncharacterized protein (TIGR03435 family)